MGYAEVKAIYDKTRTDFFVMGIAHLMNIGFENASQTTDEDIEQVEGNGIMTKSFCQELCRLAREIANSCEGTELIQLCQAEDVFDTIRNANKLGRNRLEVLLNNAIGGLVIGDYDGSYGDYKDLMNYIGADEYEMELLGYDMSDYEEEE